MALQWKWDELCGEATFKETFNGETKDVTVNLYVGNAYLIFIREWKEDDVDKYSLYSFWADKEHMKNCLGLNKKKGYVDNTFDKPYGKLVKIRLNKKKCRYYKDIVSTLAEAFNDIDIEIFSKESKHD